MVWTRVISRKVVRNGWAWVYFKEGRCNRTSGEAVKWDAVRKEDTDTRIICLSSWMDREDQKKEKI